MDITLRETAIIRECLNLDKTLLETIKHMKSIKEESFNNFSDDHYTAIERMLEILNSPSAGGYSTIFLYQCSHSYTHILILILILMYRGQNNRRPTVSAFLQTLVDESRLSPELDRRHSRSRVSTGLQGIHQSRRRVDWRQRWRRWFSLGTLARVY